MTRLFFCGDILNRGNIIEFIDEPLKDIIKSADFSVANFEAPVESYGGKIKKVGPHHYQNKNTVGYLKKCGFDMLSLANNHIYDYGETGLKETLEEINSNDLLSIGADVSFEGAYSGKIIEINNLKFGFISAAEAEFGVLTGEENRGGYAWILHRKVIQQITDLRKICDYLIMICHAGTENFHLPLPEWRDVYREFCDLGVDVIIGHHPHVPQGIEHYKKSIIFYSLGNFYFGLENRSDKTDDSFSVMVDFQKDNITYIPVFHKKINDIVSRVEAGDVMFSLDHLNSFENDKYFSTINDFCVSRFNNSYLKYFQHSQINLFSLSGIKSFLRALGAGLTGKLQSYNLKRQLFLYHNIRIDTHRFIIQRALYNRFVK